MLLHWMDALEWKKDIKIKALHGNRNLRKTIFLYWEGRNHISSSPEIYSTIWPGVFLTVWQGLVNSRCSDGIFPSSMSVKKQGGTPRTAVRDNFVQTIMPWKSQCFASVKFVNWHFVPSASVITFNPFIKYNLQFLYSTFLATN